MWLSGCVSFLFFFFSLLVVGWIQWDRFRFESRFVLPVKPTEEAAREGTHRKRCRWRKSSPTASVLFHSRLFGCLTVVCPSFAFATFLHRYTVNSTQRHCAAHTPRAKQSTPKRKYVCIQMGVSVGARSDWLRVRAVIRPHFVLEWNSSISMPLEYPFCCSSQATSPVPTHSSFGSFPDSIRPSLMSTLTLPGHVDSKLFTRRLAQLRQFARIREDQSNQTIIIIVAGKTHYNDQT